MARSNRTRDIHVYFGSAREASFCAVTRNARTGGLVEGAIALDPSRPSRIYVPISAAGFRSDDDRKVWTPYKRCAG